MCRGHAGHQAGTRRHEVAAPRSTVKNRGMGGGEVGAIDWEKHDIATCRSSQENEMKTTPNVVNRDSQQSRITNVLQTAYLESV